MLLIPRSARRAARRLPPAVSAKPTPAQAPQLIAQGRLALGSSVMRQRIQKGVGGGIVPLTGLAQEGTRGREKYEEVQRGVFEQAMQQPATHHLGPQNRIERRRIELHQQSVLQHSRRVHDTADRRPSLGAKLVQKAAQLSFIRHIDRAPDARTLPWLPVPEWRRFDGPGELPASTEFQFERGGSLRASQKDQPPRPLLDHPTGDQEAEVSQSSGDQVAAIWAPPERRSCVADRRWRTRRPTYRRP